MIAAVIALAVAVGAAITTIAMLAHWLSTAEDGRRIAEQITTVVVRERDALQVRCDVLLSRIDPLETRLHAAELSRNDSYRKATDDAAALVASLGIADAGRAVDALLSRAMSAVPGPGAPGSGDGGEAKAAVLAP